MKTGKKSTPKLTRFHPILNGNGSQRLPDNLKELETTLDQSSKITEAQFSAIQAALDRLDTLLAQLPSGSGVANQVATWLSASVLTGSVKLTFDGNVLKIGDGTGAKTLVLNGIHSSAKDVQFQSGGVGRWILRAFSAEGGADSGSDFVLRALNDAGSAIDNPISISRISAGEIVLGGTSLRPVVANGNLGVGISPTYRLHLKTVAINNQNIFLAQNSANVALIEILTDGTGNASLNIRDGSGAANINLDAAQGDIKSTKAGGGLYLKEGVNATLGNGQLVAGALVINTTKVTANSEIFVGNKGGGVLANAGTLYEDSVVRVAGTSFTVKSLNPLDTSKFCWHLVEPS